MEQSRARHRSEVATSASSVAALVERDWALRNYEDTAFSEIAETAARRLINAPGMSGLAVLEWALSASDWPHQPSEDDPFGQPHLTLWWSPRFQIDVLYWLDSTIDIHEHRFTGAFGVLHGSSIHLQFDFCPSRYLSEDIVIGDLRRRHAEMLQMGDIRRIEAGNRLIHSLYHLDSPSATLLIKSTPIGAARGELAYYPPALAFNPAALDASIRKRIQALDIFLVSRSTEEQLSQLLDGLLQSTNINLVMATLMHLCAARLSPKRFVMVAHRAREAHRELTEAVLAGTFAERRRKLLLELRRRVTNPKHRLVLATALAGLQHDEICQLIAQKHQATDPDTLLHKWQAELEDAGVWQRVVACNQAGEPASTFTKQVSHKSDVAHVVH